MQDPSAHALDPSRRPMAPSSAPLGLLAAMRPRQWVKNLLVAAAPAAAGQFFHSRILERTGIAFLAFVLASSGTYLLNDARDAEADRRHPLKRLRPVAAGTISKRLAVTSAVVLLLASIGVACALAATGSPSGATWRLTLVVALYVAQSVAYSMGAKRASVIELGLVTSGFVLRAVAGGVATGLPLSSWFLVVISFGALFVVVGKRLAELHELGAEGPTHRAVLESYTAGFLEAALTLSAGVTVTGYCLWGFAVDSNGLALHHDHLWIQLSVVPVVLAVLYVLLQLGAGRGGAPEDLVLRDRTVQALGVLWAVLVAIGIYR